MRRFGVVGNPQLLRGASEVKRLKGLSGFLMLIPTISFFAGIKITTGINEGLECGATWPEGIAFLPQQRIPHCNTICLTNILIIFISNTDTIDHYPCKVGILARISV